jgi:hypothetical protein
VIGGGDSFFEALARLLTTRGGVASDAESYIILYGSELSKMTGWRRVMPEPAFARFSKLLQSYPVSHVDFC